MKKIAHSEKSIHDVRTWPPGSFILIDQRAEWKRAGSPADSTPFVGLGTVVVNDGNYQIHVIWGDNCKTTYVVYDVRALNEKCIYHVE